MVSSGTDEGYIRVMGWMDGWMHLVSHFLSRKEKIPFRLPPLEKCAKIMRLSLRLSVFESHEAI